MVSCGLCSRWQHIPCYDHADRIAGRPRRNWDYQQFYCHRCRSQGLGTAPPTAHQSSTDGLSNSSFYSQNSRTSYSQQSAYPQSMSHRQDLRVQPLDNGVFRAYQYSHANGAPQPSAYSRSQYPTTQSLYGQFQLDQSGYAAQSSQLSAGMSRRVDSAGEQSDPSSQSHQYGSSYVNSVDSNKGTTSQVKCRDLWWRNGCTEDLCIGSALPRADV